MIRPEASVIEKVFKEQLQSSAPEVRRAAGQALAELTQGVMLFVDIISIVVEALAALVLVEILVYDRAEKVDE